MAHLAGLMEAERLGVADAHWAHNSPVLRTCLQDSSGMEALIRCTEVGNFMLRLHSAVSTLDADACTVP